MAPQDEVMFLRMAVLMLIFTVALFLADKYIQEPLDFPDDTHGAIERVLQRLERSFIKDC